MLTSSMAGLFALCVPLSWIAALAVNTELNGQARACPLLCSEIYHNTGVCKSVMYDIKHFSCILKNITSEPLTEHKTRKLTFKKVTMCVPVCDGSCDGLTTASSVTFCRLHGISNEADPCLKVFKDKSQSCFLPHFSADSKPSGNIQSTIFLHQACERGKLCMVQYILSHSLADINGRYKVGRTPVMAASKLGKVKVFDFLVSQGCDLHAVDDYGDTVLHVACKGGNIDIVRNIMINAKYDVDWKGRYSWTPVMNAVFFGHREVFYFLIGTGCNPKVMDDDGDNILHLACMKGYIDIVKYIVSKQIIDIESSGKFGRTPVMKAAWAGHVAIVKLLMSKGCNMSAVDDYKDNTLHVACFGGHVEVVKYILSKQIVDVESRGKFGRTPVLKAAAAGFVAVVKLLSNKGCNMRAVDEDKDNILHGACLCGHAEVIKYILSKRIVDMESRGKYGRTPVMKAAGAGFLAVVKLLSSKGCDMRAVDDNKDNILHVACFGGHVEVVKYILTKQIVDMERRGWHGWTPMMMGARTGHMAVVNLLKNEGCNLNTLDTNGNNILHVACKHGHVNLVKYLIKLGITHRYQRNGNGRTPLQVAKLYFKRNVVRLLQNNPVFDESEQ